MKLSDRTLTELRKIINGDDTERYRSGYQLVQFFNQLGFQDEYGQGFPSRWLFTENKLNEINGTSRMDDCIKLEFNVIDYIDHIDKLDKLISEFNKYLMFDKWKIVRSNEKITLERVDEIIIPKTDINKENHKKDDESQYVTNFWGNVNSINLQQGGTGNTQNVGKSYDFDAVIKKVEQISQYADSFDKEFGKQKGQMVQEYLKEILDLAKKRENPSRVNKLLSCVKTITMGIPSSLIASGIAARL